MEASAPFSMSARRMRVRDEIATYTIPKITEKIMSTLRESEQPDIYRPLIPKYALVAISGGIVLLFLELSF